MKRVKIAFIVLLCVLLIILVIQNTDPVEARFLWLTTQLPMVILLFVTTAGGFILGMLVSLFVRKERRKKR